MTCKGICGRYTVVFSPCDYKELNIKLNAKEKISLIRTTDDCDILQKEALKLISQGHNSSNFFKDRKDRMLGIAEKRYDLLC